VIGQFVVFAERFVPLLAIPIVVALMLPELKPVLLLRLGVAAVILIPLANRFVASTPALIPPDRRAA
jgi:hypothetical protein